MIICGIDPGRYGGIAFLDEDTPLMTVKMPTLGNVVDVVEAAQLLGWMEPKRVFIEKQSIFKGQGGAMTIGTNYGRLLALLELKGLQYKEVTPQTWTKRAGVKPGLKGREKKEASFEAARREFGGEVMTQLQLKPTMDGPVEAMLIALFGA